MAQWKDDRREAVHSDRGATGQLEVGCVIVDVYDHEFRPERTRRCNAKQILGELVNNELNMESCRLIRTRC